LSKSKNVAINQEKVTSVRGRYARFRDSLRRNPLLETSWKVGVLIVGTLVLLAGIIMLVIPGPGILGIVAGLAILATEFSWAHSALAKAKDAAAKAKTKAQSRRRKP
jgi:uncharacterized protein (TIGR02611 family)